MNGWADSPVSSKSGNSIGPTCRFPYQAAERGARLQSETVAKRGRYYELRAQLQVLTEVSEFIDRELQHLDN